MAEGPGAPDRRGLGLVLLLAGALALGFVAPALDGDAFFSTEVVYKATPPWSLVQPRTDSHNPYLSDHSTILHSWNVHTRRELRAGRWPWWTGESYAGAPYFGNFSVALLSPFTWIYSFWPSLEGAYAVVAVLKWLLAALGTWLWLRGRGVTGVGPVAGALAFGFAGYQVVWINSALTHVSVWAPWCMWAAERLGRRTDGRSVAALALVWFGMLMGGHPETSLYVVLGSGLLALWGTRSKVGSWWRRLGGLAMAGCLALGLGAFQILPFLQYALDSEGQRLRGMDLYRPLVEPCSVGGWAALLLVLGLLVSCRQWARRGLLFLVPVFLVALVLRSLGLQPTALLFLVPDLFGNPLDGTLYTGPFTYTDVSGGFFGVTAAVFAVAAWMDPERRPGVRFLGVLMMLLLARHLRLPWVSQALDLLPGIGRTAGTRALAMAALCGAGLAAHGLATASRTTWLRAVAVVLVFGLGLSLPLEKWRAGASVESRSLASESPGFRNLPRSWQPRAGSEEDWSTRLEGRAPAGARQVRVRVSGLEVGRMAAPVGLTGPWDFQVDWVGTARLEAGRYPLAAFWEDEQGREHELGASYLDLLRPMHWTWRWLLLPGLLLGLVALALGGCQWRLVRIVAVGVLCAELWVFGASYNDTTPRELVPGPVPPLAALQERMEQEGPFRILGARSALQPNLHYVVGLHALRGYDALEPLTYVNVLRYLFTGGQERLWLEQDFSTLDLESPLADVLNLRYVLSQEPPDPGWEAREAVGDWVLYENLDVRPRVYPVQQVYSLAAHDGEPPPLSTLADQAIWETGEDRSFEGEARVSDVSWRNGRVAAQVTSEQGTVLIFSENALPGWQARVDGQEVDYRRTHGTFLSLEVPPGTHRVEFRYLPPLVWLGALLGGLSLLALVVLWRHRGRVGA